MAIYHLSVKTVARSAGRSATAAAAYRAADRIDCEREGRVHDYTRKQGIAHTEIIVPDGAAWASNRSVLWNAAELAEKRVNSTVAREYELALPSELSAPSRIELARAFGEALRDRYGVAADIAIHAPHREGDQRNWHAHVLTTTRRVEVEGLGAKTRILDDRKTGAAQVVELRAAWAELSNRFLEREGRAERIDHRSLETIREARREEGRALRTAGRTDEARDAFAAAYEADRPAQAHMGPAATAMERKAAREAAEDGRIYEPATRVGAEVMQARQFGQAARDYARAWIGYARSRLDEVAGRLETAFTRIKERFLERAPARPGPREAEPGQPGEARSFLAQREGRASPAPEPEGRRGGSFLERRAESPENERGNDGGPSGDDKSPVRAQDAHERRNAVGSAGALDENQRRTASDMLEDARRSLSETLAQVAHLPAGPFKEEVEKRAGVLLAYVEKTEKALGQREPAQGVEPASTKPLSEAERQRQIDLENRDRLHKEEERRQSFLDRRAAEEKEREARLAGLSEPERQRAIDLENVQRLLREEEARRTRPREEGYEQER